MVFCGRTQTAWVSPDAQLLTDESCGTGSMSQPKLKLVTGFWSTDVCLIEGKTYPLQ